MLFFDDAETKKHLDVYYTQTTYDFNIYPDPNHKIVSKIPAK